MKIVEVGKEVSEAASKTTEQHSVSKVLGQGDKEDSHAFIELFISQAKDLHSSLPNLDCLTFLECVVDTEGVILQGHFLLDFFPFSRSKALLDVLRHVGQDKTIHGEAGLDSVGLLNIYGAIIVSENMLLDSKCRMQQGWGTQNNETLLLGVPSESLQDLIMSHCKILIFK